jgi:hypothetical protein
MTHPRRLIILLTTLAVKLNTTFATYQCLAIRYLDLESGLVKQSHHAQFDKAWYMQPQRPPAARLLYNFCLEVDPVESPDTDAITSPVPWTPLPSCDKTSGKFLVPLSCILTPLLLRETLEPSRPLTAAAALTYAHDEYPLSSAKATRI